MNTTQQSARVGLFFLLGVALVWVTFETLSDGKVFEEHTHTLIAGFDDLKQLKKGDEVRLAGVKVGSVRETRLAGRRAEAVLDIDPKVPIASDSTAIISMSGLIGGNYIAIDMGSPGSPPLADGAEIRTVESADLNTMMSEIGGLGKQLQDSLGSFSRALNGSGKDGGIIQKLDKLVTDNSARVDATMHESPGDNGQDQPRRGHARKACQRPEAARRAPRDRGRDQGHGNPGQGVRRERRVHDGPGEVRQGDDRGPRLRPEGGRRHQGVHREHPRGLRQARQAARARSAS